jgi:glutathione synthase/RimK-type ligase-like ATP-grasp enzyme
LVTNDPDNAHEFIEACSGKVIFKRTGNSPGPISKTSFVTTEVVSRLATIQFSPTTFQEYIEPVLDVRVIWVDGDYWAIASESSATATPEDCRFDYSVKFSLHHLPTMIGVRLSQFMTDLGLLWGAIDMRLGPDGEYYFLEVNPSGQFAYLEIKSGVSLFSPLAALLARGASQTQFRPLCSSEQAREGDSSR